MLFASPMNHTRMTERTTTQSRNTTGAAAKQQDIADELVLTPRTEASTPDCERSDVDDSERKQVENEISSSSSSYEDQQLQDSQQSSQQRFLQRHYSQTDNHIHLLDRNGDLNEVAGSQSMLSQELFSQDDYADEDDEGSSPSKTTRTSSPKKKPSGSILEDLGLPKGSKPRSSMGIAKQLGLLSQTQDEEDYIDNEGEQQHANLVPNSSSSQETKGSSDTGQSSTMEQQQQESSQTSTLSGLELLTQVGMNEADKAAAAQITIQNKQAVIVSEGFGSLLDAVAKITEQEEAAGGMEWVSQEELSSPNKTKKRKSPSSREQQQQQQRQQQSKQRIVVPKPQKKSETQKRKEKLRKEKIEQENEKAQAVAKKAAYIAEQTITDPVIAKKLLLSMALARENPRSIPQELPGKGHVVQKSFFWAHYPPLEHVLKKHMAEYYELSTHQCQSRQQQAFNNYMVGLVKDVAEGQQWKFAESFCDKSLRDRIRCYYKTHIQNAKKRLRTMVRNPTKKANARHLCEHLDLIEKHSAEEEAAKNNINSSVPATATCSGTKV